MSSSDIFDVLNIQQKSKSPSTGAPSPSPNLLAKNVASRPQVTGMQRELYNLLGENQPPIMVQSSNRFKEKLNSNVKPSPWTNAEFQATPTLKLKHWVKGSKELLGGEVVESSYAKFDKHLSIPTFNQEAYESFMVLATDPNQQQTIENKSEEKPEEKCENEKEDKEDNDDKNDSKEEENQQSTDKSEKSEQPDAKSESTPVAVVVGNETNEWTFAEVDYLFQLCKRFDLKWPVIFDRYSFGDSSTRSLEDLKERFYEVCKKFFLNKRPDDPLISLLNFSKKKEIERKKYLERLLARSAAEIAEEEALIIESRKFEMAAKKTLNERENLLRLLDSPNSNQSVTQYMTSQGISQLYSSLISDKSRKRKHTSSIPENPWMKQQQQFAQQRQRLQQMHGIKQQEQDDDASSEFSSPKKTKKQKQELQTAIKRKAESAYAEQLLQNFDEEELNSLGVKSQGEKLLPGAYLRSTKISTFKPALQNKIAATMQELSLPMRPVMITATVLDKHEEILKRITTLTDLKKHLDKLEVEKAITR